MRGSHFVLGEIHNPQTNNVAVVNISYVFVVFLLYFYYMYFLPLTVNKVQSVNTAQRSDDDTANLFRDGDAKSFHSPMRSYSNTRGHVCKLYKTRCTKSVRQNFFACRIVNIWNSLPDTVCFSSQAGFSQSLEDVDLSAYLRCY